MYLSVQIARKINIFYSNTYVISVFKNQNQPSEKTTPISVSPGDTEK